MNKAQLDGWDRIDAAFELLEQCDFPADFLSIKRQEILSACLEASDPGWRDRCYCYLMFFGDKGTATYMKIGISKDPSSRLAGLSTGNPLEPQWIFAFPFKDRKDAAKAEKTLHNFHSERRASGEWFRIDACQEAGAKVLSFEAFRVANEQVLSTGPMAKVGG